MGLPIGGSGTGIQLVELEAGTGTWDWYLRLVGTGFAVNPAASGRGDRAVRLLGSCKR